jgi:predicted O-methyltransferase YrrM
VWQEVLKNISDLANLNFLEIGSWEGQSTCWLLDNILTHPSSKITCIDTFEGGIEHQFSDELSLIESKFDGNLKRAKCENKLIKIVGLSQSCLRELPLSHYDVIYIDGSHIASDVLEDTILCWRLLKNGGMIIFDDYQWEGYRDQPLKHPAPAINTFLSIFQDKINVIHKGYQVIIQKKSPH